MIALRGRIGSQPLANRPRLAHRPISVLQRAHVFNDVGGRAL